MALECTYYSQFQHEIKYLERKYYSLKGQRVEETRIVKTFLSLTTQWTASSVHDLVQI